MRTIIVLAFGILTLVFTGCGANSGLGGPSPEEIVALDSLVNTKSFQINARWAWPMPSQALNSMSDANMFPMGSNATRVDITGNASYLWLSENFVKADLPYFGERQMSGGFDPRRTGIQFEGMAENLQIEPNAKNKGYTVRFNVNNGVESFQIIAQLMPSRSANLSIMSSHRTQIRYQGTLTEYKTEDDNF